MADAIDILLEKYKEHKAQARHHEHQRASATNFVIAIAGAMLALASRSAPELGLAAGAFLVAVGVFGALLSYKHYERFRYHSGFAGEADRTLRELEPRSNLERYKDVKSHHLCRFGWIARTRLHWLWIVVHLFVAASGVLLIALGAQGYG